MREAFEKLASECFSSLREKEVASLWLSAETSSFVRFNKARVRQPGDVEQRVLTLTLIRGARHASETRTLSGDPAEDARAVHTSLVGLRALLDVVPDDPHLLYDEAPQQSTQESPSELPDPRDAVGSVLDFAQGHDLVGLWASGALHRGHASSLGHRHWRTTHSFNLDFSLYADRDKAAKGQYAGARFDPSALRDRIERAAAQVEILRRPEKRIDPGTYRAYLTPAALGEVLGLLAWDAFSVKSQRTKQTALLWMLEKDALLDARVSLAEDASSGGTPRFMPSGFIRPERVPLITEGRLAGTLVSPRSAREYGLEVNAGTSERPASLTMQGGDLPEAKALERLGTGLYVTNLWYTNYSDHAAGRITGMTRFATTWVENGRMVAPLAVMRFDDTIYRLLGSELEALTLEREWMPDGGTYGERSTDSQLLPGALVRAMTFTL
ncbi:MAG: hypothetical protein K8H88_10915 [Sandaracinaceae bacterium]|nr:hypothetical protein [Sandaracinaceae bacterium]